MKKKNYKKISSESLKKEIFLLEHGFYDEIVQDFVNKNLKLFFSKESIEAHWTDPEEPKTIHPPYLSGVKLDYKNRAFLDLDFNGNYSAPRDVTNKILDEWFQSGDLLLHARQVWFKQMFQIA